MSGAAAASAAVTQDDVNQFLNQPIDAYKEACRKGFSEHKYDAITAGVTIGDHIMQNIINARIADKPPGQSASADNPELFTMVSVLAKTNVALMTSLERAQYHEKMSRALTSEVNGMKDRMTEMEEKINNHANAEEVINKMAELVKGTGPRGEGGGGEPVSEHKAIQQLNTSPATGTNSGSGAKNS